MRNEFIKIDGRKRGPTSIILAGIHGDEFCGVKAIEKVLTNLRIERGSIWFGLGNPRALENNIRYTECNLNRMFNSDDILSIKEKRSYEYTRAQFLKKYFVQADALLDIHASSIPKSKPFAICEKNAQAIVEYLPVDRVVSGFDKVEPGGTDYFMNSIGKIGICLECGYINSQKSIAVAAKGIIAFLKAQGHIINDISHRKQSYIKIYDLYITRSKTFTLFKYFDDFEKLPSGYIIGRDGNIDVIADRECVILFARSCKKIGEEAFLLGEKKSSLGF